MKINQPGQPPSHRGDVTMMAAILPAGLAMLLAAALHDVAFRTVPTMLATVLACCGAALRLSAGDLLPGLAAAALVFAAALLCWLRGWMGGGDVKLLAAAALLVAPVQVPLMLVSVSIAGGCLALPYLAGRHRLVAPRPAAAARRPAGLAARILRAERWRLGRGGPLPYAVAIGVGVGTTLLQGTP